MLVYTHTLERCRYYYYHNGLYAMVTGFFSQGIPNPNDNTIHLWKPDMAVCTIIEHDVY